MTVLELKRLIADVPDEWRVLIPVTHQFDGRWYSPCTSESGKTELGLIDDDEERERRLLNKVVPKEQAIILVPHGFTDDKDHSYEMN